MSLMSSRVRAGLVLFATLLPLCTFAAPLRLRLVRADSSVLDVPELSAHSLEERSLYGLTQATGLERGKAELVSAGALEGPDVLVGAKLGRSGQKFRLVFILQTAQLPRLSKQLAYEFTQPRLGDRGVTVMAQEIVAEAVKLEEARRSQAAEQAPAPVAAAPTSPSGTPGSVASNAPVAAAPSQPVAAAPSQPVASAPDTSSGYAEDPSVERERRAAEWKETRRPRHKLDLGLASGFNSPSGIFGLEVEYRPTEYVGLNLGGGTGAWGKRISPAARLYPFGLSGASLFLEGGLSLNMGGKATVTINGQPVDLVEQLMTPVATTSVGVRFNLDHVYFTPRVGWGFRLRQDNYRSPEGFESDPLYDAAVGLFQHGGFLISLTAGATFM